MIAVLIFGCKTQQTSYSPTHDGLALVNKVVEIQKLKEAKLLSSSLNESLLNDLNHRIRFEEGKYEEFGDLRNGVFPDDVIDAVFTEHEFELFKSQLQENFKWNESKNEATDLTYRLSKPVFTSTHKYALIMYSYGNKLHGIGSSGVMLFQKKKGEWIFIGEFWGTMT